ncbi:YbaB/EbfC family nucleoid-associated protein [Oceanivirga salmonicida]|uniref:YbaB/EbfC family nucleoid-associated protein n=1 Tax=Oceanivirga salmonicida TaxID=1769291 RepID=UPI00082DD48E|nr:YbaB/EbfC family nucleoid-associated protein [Oceanivirga salmonicida]
MVRKLKTNKSVGSQNDIIKKAKQMQEAMLVVQEGLKDKFVEASVAGEQIKVKANGQKKLIELKIGKEVLEEAVKENDTQELEQLILSAINEVFSKAEELAENEMSSVTGGVSIPGLF